MPAFNGESSPAPPGPETSLEESLKYYKAQYELLESDLADFQASSKDLEAELERDIEAAEKRERQLKDKATNLQYEVEEWKTKHKQVKTEANSAQNTLQKEITELRDLNRTLQLRLRDIEVANDDYERQQRNTESSLEDLESKYNQTIERGVMLEEEMRTGEQEREQLRIETQRLRDEFSELRIEAEITKEKLRKAEEVSERGRKPFALDLAHAIASPRSELSPTTTNESSPSFDTPHTKTASSSGLSDTPTPPSPPISEKSATVSKPFATPSLPKTRVSINSQNTTPRQPNYSSRNISHARGLSVPMNGRTAPSSTFKQSISKPPISHGGGNLPQSSSIMQLRSLRGKMQKLEERMHTAKSRLPAPVNTPPKASPRGGSAVGHHIPSSVTVRSGRRRTGGSAISGHGSLPDQTQTTPSVPRTKTARPSIGHQPTATPTRGDMAAPPPRPQSRASTSSRLSMNGYLPGHSRPGSRASISGIRTPLGSGVGSNFAPNASTDRIRPKSSLSNHGYDGTVDETHCENDSTNDYATPTPRRTTFGKRTSDIGTAIPSPTKRLSFGGTSKFPGSTARKPSTALPRTVEGYSDMRPPSRQQAYTELQNVQEGYDPSETF